MAKGKKRGFAFFAIEEGPFGISAGDRWLS